jgi:hypothetical protein
LKYIGEEIVPIFNFDTLAPQYMDGSRSTILKMDTLGFEWEVLDVSPPHPFRSLAPANAQAPE